MIRLLNISLNSFSVLILVDHLFYCPRADPFNA